MHAYTCLCDAFSARGAGSKASGGIRSGTASGDSSAPSLPIVAAIGVSQSQPQSPSSCTFPQAPDRERKGGLREWRAEARAAHAHQCAQAQPRSFLITLRCQPPEVGHPAPPEQMRAAIGCSPGPSGRSLFLISLAAGKRPAAVLRLQLRGPESPPKPQLAEAEDRDCSLPARASTIPPLPRCPLRLPTPRPSTMAASVWCREKLALGAFL